MSVFTTKPSTQEATKISRIDVHSHIKGLGLSANCEPKEFSEGMVGQIAARKAMGVIKTIIDRGALAGKAVLLAGPPGTGKTALAIALANSLGEAAPFHALSAPEIYSLEMSKAEALTQALRKAVGVRISEEADIIEGEVVEIVVDRAVDEADGLRRGKITLRTTDMESVYDCGQKMVDALVKQRVESGDVIQIDKTSGKITRLGRSIARAQDYDAMGANNRLVNCPAGELQTRRTVTHTVSLHEIDVINSRPQGFLALFSGDTGEISAEVRAQIDRKVADWLEEGKAAVVPGVLFLDEAHMLDLEAFAFLNRALEAELAPALVLATNRGLVSVRGTAHAAPHGIPPDFLERLLVVPTFEYGADERKRILRARCDEEGARVSEEALELLVKAGGEASLRYALQLMSAAAEVAAWRGAAEVAGGDVARAFELFCDAKRSAAGLGKGFVFHE